MKWKRRSRDATVTGVKPAPPIVDWFGELLSFAAVPQRLRRPWSKLVFPQVSALPDGLAGALRHKYATGSDLEYDVPSGHVALDRSPLFVPRPCPGSPGFGTNVRMPEGPQARVITLRDASRSRGVGPPALGAGASPVWGSAGGGFAPG